MEIAKSICNKKWNSIRFNEKDVRDMGRTAQELRH